MNSAVEVFIILACVYGFYGVAFLIVYLLGRRKIYPGQVLRKETFNGVEAPTMIMGTPYINASPSMGTSFVNPMESVVSLLGRRKAYPGQVLRNETFSGLAESFVDLMHSCDVTQQQMEATNAPQGAPPVYSEKMAQ